MTRTALYAGLALLVGVASCAWTPSYAAASSGLPPLPKGSVPLATFDGTGPSWDWRLVNDPVMGGVSKSTFNITGGVMQWRGEVRIVPSLQAPGFCNLETQRFGSTNSAVGTTHLIIRLRSDTPQYLGFKASFAALTLNPQFASYKSNFNVSVNSEWTIISIPWNSFSNDWSSFTGDCDTKDPTGVQHHCCSAAHPEVCPGSKDLAHIQGMGLWAEGSAGQFTLEVDFIGAAKLSPDDKSVARADAGNFASTCPVPIMSDLRYNVSDRLASDYLPFAFPAGETLAQAICCDRLYSLYAEPSGFFSRPSVGLFNKIDANNVTTFYDSACGLPVFRAPVGRTFEEFMKDTQTNGWPSFRGEEAITENLKVSAEGVAYSKCGTHVGSYFSTEGRWCIDLSCISGNPKP